MTTVPITFHVDPEAAKAYESMTAEERNKIEAVLGLRLRGLLVPTGIGLRQAMDELGQEAEANGLTPETLDPPFRAKTKILRRQESGSGSPARRACNVGLESPTYLGISSAGVIDAKCNSLTSEALESLAAEGGRPRVMPGRPGKSFQ
jgi:hypothetical protein